MQKKNTKPADTFINNCHRKNLWPLKVLLPFFITFYKLFMKLLRSIPATLLQFVSFPLTFMSDPFPFRFVVYTHTYIACNTQLRALEWQTTPNLSLVLFSRK